MGDIAEYQGVRGIDILTRYLNLVGPLLECLTLRIWPTIFDREAPDANIHAASLPQVIIPNPVINSPFEESTRHFSLR